MSWLDASPGPGPGVAALESATLVLAQGAPHTGILTGLQSPGQALSGDGAAVAYQGELGSSEGYILTIPRGYNLRSTDRIRSRGITCEPVIDSNDAPLRIAGRWVCRKVNA